MGKIENAVRQLQRIMPYLFDEYGFRVAFFTPHVGRYYLGVEIGLASPKYKCHLVFGCEDAETDYLSMLIASNQSKFENLNSDMIRYKEWEGPEQIVYLLTGQEIPGIREFGEKISPEDALRRNAEYIRPHWEQIFALYEQPGYIQEWLAAKRSERRGKQITIEQIKAERQRLHDLGLDSSLEAALKNLRGRND